MPHVILAHRRGRWGGRQPPHLAWPDLVEIAINPDGRVWMERKGGAHMELAHNIRIERDLALNLGQAIASSVGVQFSDRKPTVSGKIMFGSTVIRAQVVAEPIVEGGMAITLRPFKTSAEADRTQAYIAEHSRAPDPQAREHLKAIKEKLRRVA